MSDARDCPSTTLYVTGFSLGMRAKDLAHEFEIIGHLVRCEIFASKTVNSRLFAFIEYEDRRDSAEAMHALQGKVIAGDALCVEYAKQKRPRIFRGDRDQSSSRSSRRSQVNYRGRYDEQRRASVDFEARLEPRVIPDIHGDRGRSSRSRSPVRRPEVPWKRETFSSDVHPRQARLISTSRGSSSSALENKREAYQRHIASNANREPVGAPRTNTLGEWAWDEKSQPASTSHGPADGWQSSVAMPQTAHGWDTT